MIYAFKMNFHKSAHLVMYRKMPILLVVLVWCVSPLRAQRPPLNIPYYYQSNLYMERELSKNNDSIVRHTAVKPFIQGNRSFVPLDTEGAPEGTNFINRKLFYEHFFHIGNGDAWSIQIDPLFDFAVGNERVGSRNTWLNTRGAQLQGNIGSKIAFYSSFYENQAMMPGYIDRFVNSNRMYHLNDSTPFMPGVGIIPGQGIARSFKGGQAWDYANATAYVSYSPSEYLNFQFGQDRHFIGHGYRSMLLSDAAYPAPYFRMQANLGSIQYTYLVMQHMDPGAEPIGLPQPLWDRGFRKKYASVGYLNWQVTDRIQVGAMQSLVFPGDNPAGGSIPPSMQYLNPLIFLHPTQYGSGSEGNLLLGFNGQWEFKNNYFLYGQFVLDELNVQRFLSQSGSALNKYSGQLGLKSHSFLGIPNLFAQMEYNAARPYVYSHRDRMTSYTHYLQPLAHPLGSNFHEFLCMIDYRFSDNYYFKAKFVAHRQGLDYFENDSIFINVGSNLFADYRPDVNRTGLQTAWGERSTLTHAEFSLGYLMNPKTNMKVELTYIHRNQGTADNRLNTRWIMIGFRTALRNLYYDF